MDVSVADVVREGEAVGEAVAAAWTMVTRLPLAFTTRPAPGAGVLCWAGRLNLKVTGRPAGSVGALARKRSTARGNELVGAAWSATVLAA